MDAKRHLAELRSDYARALNGDESVRSGYAFVTDGQGRTAKPTLGRIMFMCRESAMNDLGIDLAELYTQADALGLPYEAGFDDDALAERVSDGRCVGGLVHSAVRGTYPCAGCDACAEND